MSERDTRTPDIMGIQLPSDPKEAHTRLLKLTADLRSPPYWVAKKHWFKKPPEGVRPYPECAMLIVTEDLTKKGCVQLRYHDHHDVLIGITELADGFVLLGGEVSQQYIVWEPGRKNMLGKSGQ